MMISVLSQQVLNGQIGSPKSFEFQEFFSQGRQRLRTQIFFKNVPICTKFYPPETKTGHFCVWASSAGRKQQTELSKHEKWLVPVFNHTKAVNYIYLNDNFMENFFFKFKLIPNRCYVKNLKTKYALSSELWLRM